MLIILNDTQWILCDWDDERCLKLLKNCKEAVTSKGKQGKLVIINEVVMEDHEKALLPGKERTEKEWAHLCSSAGFSSYNITSVIGIRSLIEVFP